MCPSQKSKSFQLIAHLFLLLVFMQTLFAGMKYGCWSGLLMILLVLTGGFLYARFKRNKNISA
jgi:hypothetical protein